MNKHSTMETVLSLIDTIVERTNNQMPKDYLMGYLMSQFIDAKDFVETKHPFFVGDSIYKITRVRDEELPSGWDEERGVYGWFLEGNHIGVTFDAEQIGFFRMVRNFEGVY